MRILLVGLLWAAANLALGAELTEPLAKLRDVGPKGAGHPEAIAAWKVVAAAPASDLVVVLSAMDHASPLAENWIRSAAESIAQRHRDNLPIQALERHLGETQHAPRGRRLAYEIIASVDAQARERLIPGLLNDPSLELRREAVEMALATAEKSLAAGEKATAIADFRKAFTAARDLDQVKLAAEKLKSLDETVDLLAHFGFLKQWYVIGPFDNKDTRGFDVAYPPEGAPFTANATYAGETGDVKWIEVATTDDYGVVDLNKGLGKHKGAIAYAYAEFDCAKETLAEARLGCINANKLWINGEPVFANHVYHAGMQVDQYVGKVKLKPGRNTILLKIAQNEQTESWAQEWHFQFRLCDAVGTPIPTAD